MSAEPQLIIYCSSRQQSGLRLWPVIRQCSGRVTAGRWSLVTVSQYWIHEYNVHHLVPHPGSQGTLFPCHNIRTFRCTVHIIQHLYSYIHDVSHRTYAICNVWQGTGNLDTPPLAQLWPRLPVRFDDHGAVPGAGGGEGRGQAAGARALVAVAHEAATTILVNAVMMLYFDIWWYSWCDDGGDHESDSEKWWRAPAHCADNGRRIETNSSKWFALSVSHQPVRLIYYCVMEGTEIYKLNKSVWTQPLNAFTNSQWWWLFRFYWDFFGSGE